LQAAEIEAILAHARAAEPKLRQIVLGVLSQETATS
jgi:hypothetical protein